MAHLRSLLITVQVPYLFVSTVLYLFHSSPSHPTKLTFPISTSTHQLPQLKWNRSTPTQRRHSLSKTPGTHGLTCLLVKQGKYVWLIIRQLLIKSVSVNAPLTVQDLAKAIYLKIARNTDTFSGYHLPPVQNPLLNTPPPSMTNTGFQKLISHPPPPL